MVITKDILKREIDYIQDQYMEHFFRRIEFPAENAVEQRFSVNQGKIRQHCIINNRFHAFQLVIA